jgi:cytidine deaminase
MRIVEKRIEAKEYKREELDEKYQKMIIKAYQAADKAYSPYSSFRVGASVLLDNGIIESASNQENIAYPSGMCAERVLLNYVTANYTEDKIKAIAVVSPDIEKAVSPCGACRQVMAEIIKRTGEDFEVVLVDSDTVYIINAGDLLPFAFNF